MWGIYYHSDDSKNAAESKLYQIDFDDNTGMFEDNDSTSDDEIETLEQ